MLISSPPRNNEGLPHHVTKAVLLIIEKHGGIKALDLAALREQYPQLIGTRKGDSKRYRQVINLTNKWKRWDSEKNNEKYKVSAEAAC